MIHGTNTYNKAGAANSNNHNPGGDHPLDSLFDDLIVTDNNNDYLSLGSVVVNPNQSHQSLSDAANSNNTNHEKTKAQLKNKSKFDIYLPNI